MNPRSFQMLRETAQKFPKAGSRSLNRLMRSVRTEASREIRKGYNLKKSDIDRTFQLRPASEQKLFARILARVKRLGLVYFHPRQTRTGVAVTVKKGKRLKLRHAFVVQKLSGNVFIRTSKKRLPIKRLTGPSVAELFNSQHMQTHLDAFVNREFPKILLQNIKHVLGRTGS